MNQARYSNGCAISNDTIQRFCERWHRDMLRVVANNDLTQKPHVLFIGLGFIIHNPNFDKVERCCKTYIKNQKAFFLTVELFF